MRIGFDAKRAFNNTSGLGNYSRFVLSGLQVHFPEAELHLYTPAVSADFAHFYQSSAHAHLHLPTGLGKLLPGWWRTFGIETDLLRDGIQLFHGLSNELPYGLQSQIKTVVTIHDLIFIRYPELYSLPDRKIYQKKFTYACQRADKIVAISEQTKSDVIEFLNIPAHKIEVVYQDCNSIFHTRATVADLISVKEKYNLPVQFILCVGTIEPRKNQLQLMQAWHNAALHHNLPLVFIGRRTPYFHKLQQYIQANDLASQVQFLPYIPTTELPAIYQSASLFVYPSVFEGFGIPILEALNSGVPVVTSKGSCFAEAGGPLTQYASSDDVEELAEQLTQVTSTPALREKMIASGLDHARKFRSEKTITRLHHIYKELLHQ